MKLQTGLVLSSLLSLGLLSYACANGDTVNNGSNGNGGSSNTGGSSSGNSGGSTGSGNNNGNTGGSGSGNNNGTGGVKDTGGSTGLATTTATPAARPARQHHGDGQHHRFRQLQRQHRRFYRRGWEHNGRELRHG